MIFARRVAHLVEVASGLGPGGSTSTCSLHGDLFSANGIDLVGQFDYANAPATVVRR